MTTPAYLTLEGLQRYFSAQEIAKLQGAVDDADATALSVPALCQRELLLLDDAHVAVLRERVAGSTGKGGDQR
jgi:hypothetical protein